MKIWKNSGSWQRTKNCGTCGWRDISCHWPAWNGPQRLEKGTRIIRNQRKNRDHPDYSIVKWLEYWEESWKSEETWWQSDSCERPSVNAGVKYSQRIIILRRVQETWGDLLSLKLHWKTIRWRWCEKLSRSTYNNNNNILLKSSRLLRRVLKILVDLLPLRLQWKKIGCTQLYCFQYFYAILKLFKPIN